MKIEKAAPGIIEIDSGTKGLEVALVGGTHGDELTGILHYAGSELAYLDQARLRELIEAAFGRRLVPGYFERLITRAYLDPKYRGVAVVTDEGIGVPYLDKFAVNPAHQGNGAAKQIWAHVAASCPRLFWRARPSNPICPWYQRLVSQPGNAQNGWRAAGDWVVFWRGLTAEEAAACIERAVALPSSFVP